MDIEKYSEIAPQYYYPEIPPLLKRYLEQEKFSTLLDCGCGDGSLLYSLNQCGYLNDKKVVAVDLSARRLELVRKISKNIVVGQDSAEELNTLSNQSIDFFISTQVIEHVDDKNMSEAIEKKTKSGGIIYISTVFKRWYSWYFYRNGGKWVLDPTHLREYSTDNQLLNLFDKKKFKLLENKKTLQWFPVSDFFVKRIKLSNRKLYENKIMHLIRKIKIPIPGYYNWEIVFKKI